VNDGVNSGGGALEYVNPPVTAWISDWPIVVSISRPSCSDIDKLHFHLHCFSL